MSTSKVTWVKAAWPDEVTEESLPESALRQIQVNGKRYCLARSDGKLYILDDRCPHAGASLSTGWCDNKGSVVCPYHRLRYRLETGLSATGKGYYVNSYALDNRPDGLYMAIPRRNWWSLW